MTRIEVRPALASDRGRMVAITADVWNGNDYVPFVWDNWLRDPTGFLMVASVGGEVVGLQHAQVQPDSSIWFEGIRVASECRGQGIGAALLRRGLEWARGLGAPVARLSTSSGNRVSTSLAASNGFTMIRRFVAAGASGLSASGVTDVRVANLLDREAVWAFVQEHFPGPSRLYTEGWTVYDMTPARLSLLLATHAVLLAGVSTVEGVAIVTATSVRQTPRLGLLAGSVDSMTKLARAVRASSPAALGSRATVQDDEETVRAMHAAGFIPGEHQMLLLERDLRGRPNSSEPREAAQRRNSGGSRG